MRPPWERTATPGKAALLRTQPPLTAHQLANAPILELLSSSSQNDHQLFDKDRLTATKSFGRAITNKIRKV